MERQYNKKTLSRTFQPGEQALISKHLVRLSGAQKLISPWLGPFTVKSDNGPTVTLELPSFYSIHDTINKAHVKRYQPPSRFHSDDASTDRVSEETIKPTPTRKIVQVHGCVGTGAGRKYLVQREGQSKEEAEWVALSSFNSDELSVVEQWNLSEAERRRMSLHRRQ